MNLKSFSKLVTICSCLFFIGCKGKADFKESAKSVVRIINIKSSSTGSGFCIGEELIVTNQHVIDGANADEILILAQGEDEGELQLFTGKVEWSNKDLDLAVVRVKGLKLEHLELSTIKPEKNSNVTAIGYPGVADRGTNTSAAIKEILKLKDSDNLGVIKNPSSELLTYANSTVTSSHVRRITSRRITNNGSELDVIEHDVTISGGNSGGPLLDQCGRVIGVNSALLDSGSQHGGHNFFASRITELIGIVSNKGFKISTTDSECYADLNWVMVSIGGVLTLLIIGLVITVIIISKKKPKDQSLGEYLSTIHRRPKKAKAAWRNGEIIEEHNNQESRRQSPHSSRTIDRRQPNRKSESNLFMLTGSGMNLVISEQLFRRNNNSVIIGRKYPASLLIDNNSVSRQHAILRYRNNNVYIRDNQSGNGTSINGTFIKQGEDYLLRNGDTIKLGDVVLTVS